MQKIRNQRGPGRRLHAIVALAAAVCVLAAVPPAPAARPPDLSLPARVDATLVARLALGPAMAIMSWDVDSVSRAELLGYLRANGVKARAFSHLPVAYACIGSPADAATMARAPGAGSVVADEAVTPTLERSVPSAFAGDPKLVWQGMNVTGSGVTVVVLDTGVDGSHPDVEFGRRMHQNVRVLYSHEDLIREGQQEFQCEPDRYTDEFVDHMENTDPYSGHGTFMAGVAAGDGTASEGRYTGVAPGAEIVGIGAANTHEARIDLLPGCASRGHMTYDDDLTCEYQISTLAVIGGINFALSRLLGEESPAKVILAGWRVDGLYDPLHPLAKAIRFVPGYGVAFVSPTGNAGPDESDCEDVETCFFNPAAVGDETIAVAAGPRTGRRSLERYSSRGDPKLYDYHFHEFRYEPTITAPGSGVVAARGTVAASGYLAPPLSDRLGGHAAGRHPLEPDPDYVAMSGTSAAAAHVAGAIALMQEAAVRAKGCYLTVEQVKEVLEETATPMPRYTRWEAGAGFVDIRAAVEAAEWWPRLTDPQLLREPYMCPNP